MHYYGNPMLTFINIVNCEVTLRGLIGIILAI